MNEETRTVAYVVVVSGVGSLVCAHATHAEHAAGMFDKDDQRRGLPMRAPSAWEEGLVLPCHELWKDRNGMASKVGKAHR